MYCTVFDLMYFEKFSWNVLESRKKNLSKKIVHLKKLHLPGWSRTNEIVWHLL